MHHNPEIFDRRHLDNLTALVENARYLDRSDFHAANASIAWPALHRSADLRGVMPSRGITRSQLTSSDNPFQIGVSEYI